MTVVNMPWQTGLGLVGCGLALALMAGTADATPRTVAPAPSARPLLITRAGLGTGWRVTGPAPTRVAAMSCHSLPAGLQSQRRQAAASATFGQDSSGPFVEQAAYRWASAATATAIWRQVARPSMLTCLAQSLTHGGSRGVTFTVTGRRRLAAPLLPVGIRSYRVTATATTGGQDFPAYVDELVINTPGALSEISLASFEQPPPARLEDRIARLVGRRGAAAAHGSVGR
jgi:hypothetical protein